MSKFKVGDIVKDSYWVNPYYYLIIKIKLDNSEIEEYFAYGFSGFLEEFSIKQNDTTCQVVEISELFKD